MPRRNSAALTVRTRQRSSLKGKTITVWDSLGKAHKATVVRDFKHHLTLRHEDGSISWAGKPYSA